MSTVMLGLAVLALIIAGSIGIGARLARGPADIDSPVDEAEKHLRDGHR